MARLSRRGLLTIAVRERTTLRAVVLSFTLVALGVVFLLLSAPENTWITNNQWRSVVNDLGGLLVVSAAVSMLWELYGRRAFLDELLVKMDISNDVSKAGIVGFSESFTVSNIDWDSLFKNSRNIDIFFAYGRTWRGSNSERLTTFLKRSNVRLRLILPDPENTGVVAELARRFNAAPGDVENRIRESARDFLEFSKSPRGSAVEIWYVPVAPLFSYYLFDNSAVLTLYTHRKKRTSVPAFLLTKEGSLYKYLMEEHNFLLDKTDGAAKRFQ